MTALTTDQKYADLLEELERLNNKFDRFMNGDSLTTIPVDNGPNIKSLSGTVADLNRFKYVQRVIDHRLYQDMVDDDIEVGMLIRVWGDTNLINGLYKKNDGPTYTKTTYSDLYDLRDFLPNPWNYTRFKKSTSEFTGQLDLLSFTVDNSVSQTTPNRLSGNAMFSVDGLGRRGSYSFDFVVNTTTGTGGQTDRVGEVLKSNLSTISLDADFVGLIKPDIQVVITPGPLKTTYKIVVTDFRLPDNITNVPANLSINFNGIDSKYTKL